MPSLSNVLASIPGYGAYVAKRQLNEEQPLQEAQQAGALIGLQEKLRAQQQEQAFRKDLAALGPGATQEQLAQVAAKYAGPADVLKTQQSSLDRQSALEVAKENKAAQLAQAKATAEQTHELRMSQLRGDAERRVETARHNRVVEGIQAQIATIRGTAQDESKPPPGYRKTPEGNLEAIPGGPADQKLQGQLNQDTATLQGITASMDRLAVAANEMKNHPGLSRITGIVGALPDIPGSAAANARAKLQTLKAQVGFAVLQDMRNASKTGGALGQITERELAFLQNALAALDTAQDDKQIKESLDKIIGFVNESKDRIRAAFNMKHKDKAAPTPAAPAAPSVESLLEKYK